MIASFKKIITCIALNIVFFNGIHAIEKEEMDLVEILCLDVVSYYITINYVDFMGTHLSDAPSLRAQFC